MAGGAEADAEERGVDCVEEAVAIDRDRGAAAHVAAGGLERGGARDVVLEGLHGGLCARRPIVAAVERDAHLVGVRSGVRGGLRVRV